MQKIIDNIKIIKKLLLAVAIVLPFAVFADQHLAKDFGTWALNMLFLSLIIGPLGKIFKNKFMDFMMLIRGEIGILMASFALSHGVSILSNPLLQSLLMSANFVDMFTKYLALTMGMTALLLTIPLLITSNIYLKDKMGVWWFRMHKLAYAIFIIGALHSVFIEEISVESAVESLTYIVPYVLILIAAKIWGKKK